MRSSAARWISVASFGLCSSAKRGDDKTSSELRNVEKVASAVEMCLDDVVGSRDSGVSGG